MTDARWLGIGLVLIVTAAAPAATIFVNDDAPDDPGPGDPDISDPLEDGTATHPFDSIQEAIDASVDGDMVRIAAGTYTGTGNRDMDFGGRAIEVRGADANTTIIDCQGSAGDRHRGFTFDSGETSTSVLRDVTITSGYAGSPTDGGAILAMGGTPTLIACRFVNNWAVRGGAIACSGSLQFTDCEFLSNHAFDDFDTKGGAVYAVGGTLEFTDCTFESNAASGFDGGLGGALHLAADAIMTDCVIDNNVASGSCSGRGGGIEVTGANSIEMTRCRITNNRARGVGGCAGSGVASGGGGRLRGELTDCVISGNRALGYETGEGGGLYLTGTSTLTRCVVSSNLTRESFLLLGTAGGLLCTGATTLTNCVIARNKADYFAGVWMQSTSSAIIGCTFTRNMIREPKLGFPDPSGSAIAGSVPAIGCVIWDNVGPAIDGAPVIEHSVVDGGYAGVGNIDSDPLFLSASAGRFELLPGSAGIDAGDNTAFPLGTLTDVEGNPRFVDDPDTPDTGSGTPPLADMGAVEKQGPPCAGDINRDGTVNVDDLVQVITEWGVCCTGDMNFDTSVDHDDELLLSAQYGTRCPASGVCPGDLNGDGMMTSADGFLLDDTVDTMCPFCPSDVSNNAVVNVDDLVQVILDWGACQ